MIIIEICIAQQDNTSTTGREVQWPNLKRMAESEVDFVTMGGEGRV